MIGSNFRERVIEAKTNALPSDPASESSVETAISNSQTTVVGKLLDVFKSILDAIGVRR